MISFNQNIVNCIKKSIVDNHVLFQQIKSFTTKVDIFDVFDQKGAPKYDNAIPEMPGAEPKKRKYSKKDAIIECKRSELNHYKNQTYNKLAPIPLASKGWNHYKSKGDYFKIQVYDEHEDFKKLFWNLEGKSFSDLNLDQNIADAVKSLGFDKPTFIQESAIPTLLQGHNSLITAETGCGKTLAYLLPMIQQIIELNKVLGERPLNSPLGLILCPNRELVFQIAEIAKKLSYILPFRCDLLVGGRTKRKMLNPDFKQVDLQIATIGALSKLTTVKLFNVDEVRHLVLDEADTMLDDSFNELLLHFLKKINVTYKRTQGSTEKGCQLSLVSATKPTSLYSILSEFIETDSLKTISSPRLHRIMPHVPQTFCKLGLTQKPAKILSLARAAIKENKPTMIFSNKAPTCDWISLMLEENNVPALNLNGEMPLVVRMGKFKQFKEGEYKILSCTDIASRGLDTRHVKQVINYDFPLYIADYIHRCGRTGRCGSPEDCSVVNFVSGEREVELVQQIETAVRTQEAFHNVNANITKIIKYKRSKMGSN